MNIQLKINGQNIKLSEETIKELSKTIKFKPTLRPQLRDSYSYFDSEGVIYDCYWDNCIQDNNRFRIGNCFPTAQKAKTETIKRKIIQTIKNYIHNKFDTFTPEWNKNRAYKTWGTYYNNRTQTFQPHLIFSPNFDNIYLKTKEQTEQLIQQFSNELKTLYNIDQ